MSRHVYIYCALAAEFQWLDSDSFYVRAHSLKTPQPFCPEIYTTSSSDTVQSLTPACTRLIQLHTVLNHESSNGRKLIAAVPRRLLVQMRGNTDTALCSLFTNSHCDSYSRPLLDTYGQPLCWL